MYHLLIVEDEDIIRAGIKKIIQEMDFGFQCILEASSGKEALEIAKKQDVHIIVTDIKMENGDGLELIRGLGEAGIRCKMIILSGYGEFAYAQQAISLGVSEYLLKPLKKKNLREALTKLIAQLDAQRVSQPATMSDEDFRTARQQRLLGEIVQDKHAASDIESLLSSVEIPLSSRYLFAVSIHVEDGDTVSSDLVGRITGSSNQAITVRAACESEPGHVLFMIGTDDSALASNRQLDSSLRGLLETCGVAQAADLAMGISDVGERPEQLPRLIEQSAYALDFRLLRPSTRNLYYKGTVPLDPPSPVPNVFLQTVRSSLHEGNQRAMTEALDGWFRVIREQTNITPSFVVDTLYNLLVYSEFTYDKEQNWNSRTHSELTRMYRSSATLEDFQVFVKTRFASVRRGTVQVRNGNYDSNVISFIVKYLEHHYDEDVTLRSAADKIFMNPSYFSSLFKKKTGINFVHYLQKLRIEKSKTLLRDPQYKIYEVASKIGFSDEKYFFKVFKNVTGITPNEYRDKHQFV